MRQTTSAPDPATDTPNKHSTMPKFLSLPGELRNRIYDICVEDYPRSYIPGISRPGQYLGLALACRQVRSEFLPIYIGCNVVNVPATELPTYIRTFYPSEDAETAQAYRGTINIFLDLPFLPAPYKFDLAPIFKLLTRCPNVSCRAPDFKEYHTIEAGYAVEIDMMLQKKEHAVWRKAIKEHIESVLVEIVGMKWSIVFVLHPNDDTNKVLEDKITVQEWMAEIGLPRVFTNRRFWLYGDRCKLSVQAGKRAEEVLSTTEANDTNKAKKEDC
ncbi:hypothetical protein BDV95DRAFT_572552 [Massariosphaeria phaeospora]|uniref:F-box domain-containing protein n=1 Tax=Massariosphaeria phaeospora TaxID=100035 RepID=A0A7C8I9T1_9PLEO|nr:hypothetical protein BDV95DRAFT_572552 [Massariosphaeria phaeospora]